MENKFLKIVEKNFWDKYKIYDLDWWKCALNNDLNTAFVISNWRYPSDENLFSINEICTEKIFILEWEWEFFLNDCKIFLKKWCEIEIKPWNKYSIKWKDLLCRVEISPKWDSGQNKFV